MFVHFRALALAEDKETPPGSGVAPQAQPPVQAALVLLFNQEAPTDRAHGPSNKDPLRMLTFLPEQS
jgi:hypothetical protein